MNGTKRLIFETAVRTLGVVSVLSYYPSVTHKVEAGCGFPVFVETGCGQACGCEPGAIGCDPSDYCYSGPCPLIGCS